MCKKIISVFLALTLLVGCFSLAVTAEEKAETKVSFTATSNNTDFLLGQVFDDYSAKITVPKGSLINAGEVTGSLEMTDIESLGIEGTRKYEKSITTGVEKEVLLDNYLPYFTNATVSGTIDGNAYSYNVLATDSEESYVVEAIPDDVEAARTAFHALTSHVTASTKAEDDSYAIIPGDAYIQVGTEKLSLENTEEALKLDNIVQGTGLKAEIRSAVKLEEAAELDDAQVQVYLPAGTVLAMGQSVVKLNDHATVNMYGYEDNDDVNTILSKLRDCETNEEIILTAVLFISDFANSIEGQDLVVNVDFEEVSTVSGTVESFVFDDATTIELVSEGQAVQSVSVEGAGVQTYSFDNVDNGTYTLRVSKKNHVSREYEVTVAGEDLTEALTINLLGDVNGDGKVNTIDTARANAHAKNMDQVKGYALLCGDINTDGKINTVDVARINAHAKGVSLFW